MNNFDYDVMQKKRIARGAYAKKNGSRSKKCTLPGDYLTPAEKKKLSTTLVDVNLKKPMTYEQFQALPTDVKREYLEFLRDECGSTMCETAEMFGMSRQLFCRYVREHEPTLKGIFPKGRSSAGDIKQRKEKWDAFLAQDSERTDGIHFKTYKPKPPADEDVLDEDEDEDEPAEEKAEPTAEIPLVSEVAFKLFDEHSAEDICRLIRAQMGDRRSEWCSVSIMFADEEKA